MNNQILIWARETAGLTLEVASQKLGINHTKMMTAAERLAAMEAGQTEPSRSLLLKMSQQYRRPLVTFYMGATPRNSVRLEDFRNIPDRDAGSDALIAAMVRDVRSRQTVVRELMLDDEETLPLPFVASKTARDGVKAVVASIRETLGVSLAEYRSQATPEAGFTLLRSKAEVAGIFVLLIGNLGSHHTAIDAEAFRGFALADDVAPFVVINDQDARTAWTFSLMHELAHIWLGASGVSGKVSDQTVEKFCNDVASEFLLPPDELALMNVGLQTTQESAARSISDFARQRHLSSTMVAYNLARAGLITNEMYLALAGWFRSLWRRNRDLQKERQKDNDGPNYYVVRRHRLGGALLDVVARSLSEGTLSPTKAGQILGVKPRNVAPLLNDVRSFGGRAA